MRAVLLANATVTSIGGLRASIRPSHEPAGTPLRLAHRTTALEAMMRRRRNVYVSDASQRDTRPEPDHAAPFAMIDCNPCLSSGSRNGLVRTGRAWNSSLSPFGP